MRIISFLLLILLALNPPVYATVGFAEWSLETPGGSAVSHADPWKEQHGTCLKDKTGDTIYVAHIAWWQYYQDHVVGKAVDTYFIFSDKKKTVRTIEREKDFLKKIKKLKRQPLSKKMTPADGWQLVWDYHLAKMRQQDENTDPAIKKILQDMLEKYDNIVYDEGNVLYFKVVDDMDNEPDLPGE